MRERWFGATGRKVPQIALEGTLDLEGALVLDDVSDLAAIHAAHEQGVPIVGETFHRGYMAASIGLFTAYQAATGALDVSKMPQEQRDSLFKLACVSPQNYQDYTKYDSNIPGWVDTLIANGPFKTEPTPLVGQGPEKLPS